MTGFSVEYTIHTWDVPVAADGGSLAVINEPDEAVLGATETIDIGWSELEFANNYLGAVGHNDESGLFDVTLVEVSTE